MKTEEMNLERMVNSLTLLLGMATAMLFEVRWKMTEDQTTFLDWWKGAMYDVVYKGEPVPMNTFPEKK